MLDTFKRIATNPYAVQAGLGMGIVMVAVTSISTTAAWILCGGSMTLFAFINAILDRLDR